MRLACVRWLLSPLLLTAALTACDDGGGGSNGESKTDAKPNDAAGDLAAAKEASPEPTDTKTKPKKDRGDASVTLDGAAWTAENASARILDGKLKLDLSRLDRVDGKMSRDAFSIIVPGYQGPGDYTTGPGSMFVGVGFDIAEMKAAEGEDGKADDAKVEKATVDAIKGAKTMMLQGMKVHVESDDNDQIVGTFEKPDGTPPLTDGKFRAIVKKRT